MQHEEEAPHRGPCGEGLKVNGNQSGENISGGGRPVQGGNGALDIAHVFRDYASESRWVTWTWRRDGKRVGKPPQNPKPASGGGHLDASPSDPKTWGTLAQALAASPRARVGICATPGPLACLDLDGCLRPGEVAFTSEDARHAVEILRSYTEVSPSEAGVKVFFHLPEGVPDAERRYFARAMAGPVIETDSNDRGVVQKKKPKAELFAQVSGHYLTVTGRHLPDTPTEIRTLTPAEWRTLLDWVQPAETEEDDVKEPAGKVDIEELRKALTFIEAVEDYDIWVTKVGFGLHGGVVRGQLSEADALALYHEWAARAEDKYDRAETDAKWRGFNDGKKKLRGLRTIWKAAEANGYERPRRRGKGDKESAADVLIAFLNEVELWHDEGRQAYATITVDGHRENHRVASREFRLWLAHLHYEKTGRAVYAEAVRMAIQEAEARALFKGRRHQTWLRTARGPNGHIYVDLGDPTWRAVEVQPGGWGVVAEPPVKFRRSGNMGALPEPTRGGTWRDFRPFTNFARVSDLRLDLATSVAYFVPDIPYPITLYVGASGAAKSTALDNKTGLIDPQRVSRPGPPDKEDDLVVVAQQRRLVAYDNLSHISPDMADAYCRLATGGGIEKRKLFTDDEQHSIDVKRPLALTGIKPNLERQDLVDRMVIITLAPIGDDRRIDEETFRANFEAARPRLLGVLLDGVAVGLANHKATKRALRGRLPRMADFAIWAEASATAFGFKPGKFLAAYGAMAAERMGDVAEEDPVAGLLAEWLFGLEDGRFEGSSKELHQLLAPRAHERRLKGFPNNPSWLGRHLASSTKLLDVLDIDYERFGPNRRNHRLQHRLKNPRGVEERLAIILRQGTLAYH